MRHWLILALTLVSTAPALGQSAPQSPQQSSTQSAPQSGQVPIDVGPNTPAANKAYQGGGVILQGAPGAPAPKPQATPPGQTPQNMVPPSQ